MLEMEDSDAPEDELIEPGEDDANDDAAHSYAQGEPPAAEVLGIDIAGLSPQRARLVRFIGWMTQTRGELDELEDGRARFLEALGVPAVTRQKIDELIASDATGLVAWMKTGAMGITPRQVHSFERQQLEAKLKDDTHKAEVAKAALRTIEREIVQKKRQVEELEARRRDFVFDVLIEEADRLGRTYLERIEQLRATLTPLVALGEVVGLYRDYRAAGALPEVEIRLPRFGLPALANAGARHGTALKIDAETVRGAARRWRSLAEAWAKDPRAPGFDDERGAFRAAATNDVPSPEPAAIDEPSVWNDLPARLHAVTEELAVRGATMDWPERASDIAYTIERLRADEGADLADGDISAIVAALLDVWICDTVDCAPQAIVASFSALARHQELAEIWFADHPDDRPTSADVAAALSG
ncbi:MAG TPA: hypothetical protein VKZ79_02160 [Alphaproteobacteria bacterium]|nr:hypothetical protein [Alphaproteobacteria bacterium]